MTTCTCGAETRPRAIRRCSVDGHAAAALATTALATTALATDTHNLPPPACVSAHSGLNSRFGIRVCLHNAVMDDDGQTEDDFLDVGLCDGRLYVNRRRRIGAACSLRRRWWRRLRRAPGALLHRKSRHLDTACATISATYSRAPPFSNAVCTRDGQLSKQVHAAKQLTQAAAVHGAWRAEG